MPLRSHGEARIRRLRTLTRFGETTERHQRLRKGVQRLRVVGIVLAKDVSTCLGAPVKIQSHRSWTMLLSWNP